MVNLYKHSHSCVHSRNKYSEILVKNELVISGFGVSSNVLINSFPEIKFSEEQDKEDEYSIKLIGKLDLINDILISANFHDDCFFEIEFKRNEYIKSFILGIIQMHQEYIKTDGCIKEPDISTEVLNEILKYKKVSFKTLNNRVLILKRPLTSFDNIFSKFTIKDKDILWG